jgi:hypothetical protein
MSRKPAGSRLAFVLLLMCAIICAQAASLASEHFHQHSSQHCCGLCHVGPMPFLRAAVFAGPAPMVTLAWISRACDFDTDHEVLLTAGDSRAPPVSSPLV